MKIWTQNKVCDSGFVHQGRFCTSKIDYCRSEINHTWNTPLTSYPFAPKQFVPVRSQLTLIPLHVDSQNCKFEIFEIGFKPFRIKFKKRLNNGQPVQSILWSRTIWSRFGRCSCWRWGNYVSVWYWCLDAYCKSNINYFNPGAVADNYLPCSLQRQF